MKGIRPMEYPRPLRPKERDLLDTVLPADSPGYGRYHERLKAMRVIARGRRGEGDLILGFPGDCADVTSPLAPVIAYGMVETTQGAYSITVREESGEQVNVEIVSGTGEEIPDHYEEKRRWTYSSWRPGLVSPATGTAVREVAIGPSFTLAFSPAEKRIWMHDRATGFVHLIPITNFHNELMLWKGIRDPGTVLRSTLFWEGLPSYADEDLRRAFVAYNRLKRRVAITQDPPALPARGFSSLLKNLFVRSR